MSKHLALLATALFTAGAVVAVSLPTRAAAQNTGAGRGLTDGAQLAAIYDTILRGRSDAARTALARTCPPTPAAACDALREVSIWWEIQQDLPNRQRDNELQTSAAAAIASATAWTTREPNRGEAWFYLAGAYAPLSQWRVQRGEKLIAARDAKRIKDALERALALDPSLNDAWFGIGLYHYYADVAPTVLKLLRFLLLLPGGNREQGMREMLRTRQQGQLLRGEADFQMHWLYDWYEERPDRALELLRGLAASYPTNPLFAARIAEVQHVNFSDHQGAAATWQQLLERATTDNVAFAALTAARARVGLARELVDLSQPRQALATLDPVLRARPSAPYGITAEASLTRGDALAAIGDRTGASSAYTQAIADAPRDDPAGIRRRAREGQSGLRSRR